MELKITIAFCNPYYHSSATRINSFENNVLIFIASDYWSHSSTHWNYSRDNDISSTFLLTIQFIQPAQTTQPKWLYVFTQGVSEYVILICIANAYSRRMLRISRLICCVNMNVELIVCVLTYGEMSAILPVILTERESEGSHQIPLQLCTTQSKYLCSFACITLPKRLSLLFLLKAGENRTHV